MVLGFKQTRAACNWRHGLVEIRPLDLACDQRAIRCLREDGSYRAGGVGMPPINMVGDVMRAGFKQVVRLGNPSPSSTGPNIEGADAPIAKFGLFDLYNRWFQTEQSAVDYINRVAGEVTTTTQPGGETKTRAGQGLRAEVIKEADRIRPLLRAAVTSATPMTAAQRRDISKGGSDLSPLLIKSIRDMPLDERKLITERLVNEIANASSYPCDAYSHTCADILRKQTKRVMNLMWVAPQFAAIHPDSRGRSGTG